MDMGGTTVPDRPAQRSLQRARQQSPPGPDGRDDNFPADGKVSTYTMGLAYIYIVMIVLFMYLVVYFVM